MAALGTPGRGGIASFPIRHADGLAQLVAHLVPIRRTAHDIFANSLALLVLTDLAAKRAPEAALLRSLFDLTPAEARIAAGLAQGQSLEEIAASGGVSSETVRKQVQRVFEKTGCNRQAEVAALLANVILG